MIRMTSTVYDHKTKEIESVTVCKLKYSDAKWWMDHYGMYNNTLGKHKKRRQIKRRNGKMETRVEFLWLDNLEYH